MPAFWSFAEAAEHAPEEQIPALFQKHLVEAHPELFVSGVLGDPMLEPLLRQGLRDLARAHLDEHRPLGALMRR